MRSSSLRVYTPAARQQTSYIACSARKLQHLSAYLQLGVGRCALHVNGATKPGLRVPGAAVLKPAVDEGGRGILDVCASTQGGISSKHAEACAGHRGYGVGGWSTCGDAAAVVGWQRRAALLAADCRRSAFVLPAECSAILPKCNGFPCAPWIVAVLPPSPVKLKMRQPSAPRQSMVVPSGPAAATSVIFFAPSTRLVLESPQ